MASRCVSSGRCRPSRRGWRWRRSGWPARPDRRTAAARTGNPGWPGPPRPRSAGRARPRSRAAAPLPAQRWRPGRSLTCSADLAEDGQGPGVPACGLFRPPLVFRDLAELLIALRHSVTALRHPELVIELLVDGQGPGVPVRGLIQPPPVMCDLGELAIDLPCIWPVAELLADGQGPGIPVRGLIQPPPVLCGNAELVIAVRHPEPVVELLEDGQGPGVPVRGLFHSPSVVCDGTELSVDERNISLLARRCLFDLKHPQDLMTGALGSIETSAIHFSLRLRADEKEPEHPRGAVEFRGSAV